MYRCHFRTDNHFFISETFTSVVVKKTEEVLRLMKDDDSSMGIMFGLKEKMLCNPFSAPFGGFHFTHESLPYNIIYDFIYDLKEYIIEHDLLGVCITLPPDIYQCNTNAKCINAFIRLGFKMLTPDLTNWINLKQFDGNWTNKKIHQNIRKAFDNQLSCTITTDKDLMKEAFNLISLNRIEQGRKIHMTLEDILELQKIIPIDFFIAEDANGQMIGSGVIYRGHKTIAQAIFMADDLNRRDLRVIDFIYLKVFEYYKQLGYDFIDLGTSSLCGEPNIGLIRFKEFHNCVTSLRYSFTWKPYGELLSK